VSSDKGSDRDVIGVITIAAVILPLALDTFVLGAALGAAGIERRERLRVSLILSGFEAGMPLVGFLLGARLGSVIGGFAGYVAALVLAATGVWMLRSAARNDGEEERQVRLLESAHGWSVIVLGVGISLDELAIGFGAGLLTLPLAVLVVLIAAQAFLAAQVGMRLGSRIAERTRESAERAAGLLLVAAGALVAAERLIGP
jgi:manganese efflux pump family protein